MAMKPADSRYDRTNVPESSWPDGTPVSNWSQAVARLALAERRARASEKRAESADEVPFLAMAA
jgi:hypothetical protein